MSGVLPGLWQEQRLSTCEACPPSQVSGAGCWAAGASRRAGVPDRSLGIWGLPVRLQGMLVGKGQRGRSLEPDSGLRAWPCLIAPSRLPRGPSYPESVPRGTHDPLRK